MNLYFLIWLCLTVGYTFVAYRLLCHLERKAEPHAAGIFTKDEVTKLIALQGCFNELEERIERHTYGAEYDSTC